MGYGRVIQHLGIRLVLAVVALALVVSACGGGSAVSKAASGSGARASSAPEALPRGSRVLLDAAEPLSWAYAGGGSLYFSYASPVGEHVGEDYEMLRVNTATGGVAARRHFTSAPAGAVLTGGSLWVTTTIGNRTTLWRLGPSSLAIRSQQTLPAGPGNEGITGSLAVAGGQLWVGTGLIDRVSLRSGRVDRVVTPSHQGPVQLGADPTGRVLLASLGYEHPTYIDRLNLRTGTPLSELTIARSDPQPRLAGIVDGGAWIENGERPTSSVWRISLRTMQATKASAWIAPGSRISVRAIDGVLWVTQSVGQNNVNYCADPVTGRALARLPLLRGDSVFLTADKTSFFYTDVPINAHKVKLESAPISPECARG